jgi:hypothetical protein
LTIACGVAALGRMLHNERNEQRVGRLTFGEAAPFRREESFNYTDMYDRNMFNALLPFIYRQ